MIDEIRPAAELEERRLRTVPYATPAAAVRRPPFDWGAAFRQIVFAFGIGLLAAGTCWVSSRDAQNGPAPFLFFFGAAMVGLTLPWPGRIGRRREFA